MNKLYGMVLDSEMSGTKTIILAPAKEEITRIFGMFQNHLFNESNGDDEDDEWLCFLNEHEMLFDTERHDMEIKNVNGNMYQLTVSSETYDFEMVTEYKDRF